MNDTTHTQDDIKDIQRKFLETAWMIIEQKRQGNISRTEAAVGISGYALDMNIADYPEESLRIILGLALKLEVEKEAYDGDAKADWVRLERTVLKALDAMTP